jgi:hypothetical protein
VLRPEWGMKNKINRSAQFGSKRSKSSTFWDGSGISRRCRRKRKISMNTQAHVQIVYTKRSGLFPLLICPFFSGFISLYLYVKKNKQRQTAQIVHTYALFLPSPLILCQQNIHYLYPIPYLRKRWIPSAKIIAKESSP